MVDVTSWLLFFAGLTNQMGRVMIPAVKTSIMDDAEFGPDFKANVGGFLSGVSLVCMGGKMLGAAVTDKLGGWVVLTAVFAIWIVATLGAVSTPSVMVFGGMWLFNSLAYTVTWGAQVQVIGAVYAKDERPAQLSNAASSSRVGATVGNIAFGQLLSAGVPWRKAIVFMLPLQVVADDACEENAVACEEKTRPPDQRRHSYFHGSSRCLSIVLSRDLFA
jgi:MFS family permease